MSVHFRNCWMDFDICCFELASLDALISADSRFKPVGGEIWYESAGAKKHRIVSREKTCFQQRGIRNVTAEKNVIAWENKKQK